MQILYKPMSGALVEQPIAASKQKKFKCLQLHFYKRGGTISIAFLNYSPLTFVKPYAFELVHV